MKLANLTKNSIDVPTLPTGIYILKLNYMGGNRTDRFAIEQ